MTWDLGADTPVRCALIDADGDDAYTLSLSKDGKDFLVLYRAAPDEDRGQQLRAGRDLNVSGRYLLLSAAGGDGVWSVSEVSAWRDCPKSWPPLAMQKGTPDDESMRLKLWAFAALAIAYVLAYLQAHARRGQAPRRRPRRRWHRARRPARGAVAAVPGDRGEPRGRRRRHRRRGGGGGGAGPPPP